MSSNPSKCNERQILVCHDSEAVAVEAATIFVRMADESIQKCGRFTVVLSGGSTPRRLFEILAATGYQHRVRWDSVFLFWGDERYVPSDDPRNNFRMTMETLLSQVPIPPGNVHRIRTELSPAEAVATNYESEIARFFAGLSPKAADRFPAFELVFLGLGANAHTASLFPDTLALHESSHLVVAEFVTEVNMWRITMTAQLLNAGKRIVFLVCGSEKAHVVRDVLFGDYDPQRKPAQLIQPTSGQLTWLIDAAAAAELPSDSYHRTRPT